MDISKPHPSIACEHERWNINADVIAGHYAVKKRGIKYLPKAFSDQEAKDYKSFKDHVSFYPAANRTLTGLLGLMFRRAPVLENEGIIEAQLKDIITRDGKTVNELAKAVCKQYLTTAFYGLLVDHPSGSATSAGEAIAEGTLAVYTPNGKQQLFYLDGEGAVLNSLIADKIEVKQAQIGDLLVDTIHVAGNAITANTFHTAGDRYCPAGGTVDFLTTGFNTIGDGFDGSAIVNIKFTIDATAYYDASCFVELFLDTGDGRGWVSVDSAVIGISTNNGNSYWRVAGNLIGGVDGQQVRVLARVNSGQHTPNSVSRSFYVRNISMTIMGAKR